MGKHLTGLGKNWYIFLDPVILTYKTYGTPNLKMLTHYFKEN